MVHPKDTVRIGGVEGQLTAITIMGDGVHRFLVRDAAGKLHSLTGAVEKIADGWTAQDGGGRATN